MGKLRIAIQKSGRLSEQSLEIFGKCGIKISNSSRRLRAEASNFPLEVLFLRDDDIPQYVQDGIADLGIIGQNELYEQNKEVKEIQTLGFAGCRMSLAVPREIEYTGTEFFEGGRIATSYPNILSNWLQKKGVKADIETIGGSVELAPSIGLSQGIFDIVSTGSTLLMNGLKEVEVVLKSEATLIGNKNLNDEQKELLDKLLFRVNSVLDAQGSKYILLNAPNDRIPEIIKILPGIKSPTVLPLVDPSWSSLHAVVREEEFWDIIDQLKALGAEGILVSSIEKLVI